jgi:hypothetical protein
VDVRVTVGVCAAKLMEVDVTIGLNSKCFEIAEFSRFW